MRSCYAAFALAILLGIAAWPANAQVINVGNINIATTPTPGSGHDYLKMINETVNPANGSLSLRIDAPEPQQRGDLNFPYHIFGYDSDGVSLPIATVNYGYIGTGFPVPGVDITWSNSSSFNGSTGATLVGLIPGGFIANTGIGRTFEQSVSLSVGPSPTGQPASTCDYATGFFYFASDASKHSLNVQWQTASTGEGCNYWSTGGTVPVGGDSQLQAELVENGADASSFSTYVADPHG